MFKIRKGLEDVMPCAHGGKLQEVAERMGVDEKDFLDFSVNVNPYIPVDVHDVIENAYHMISVYPDNRYEKFRKSAAKFAGVRMENVIPGNGSTEIIRLFAESVIDKGDLIAIPCPTFGEYEQQCRLFGAGIRYVRYSDILKKEYWHMNGCKAAFFCNPNNPDGRLLSADEMLDIVDHCKKNGIIAVVDEAFIDLADPKQSIARCVDKYDNLLVMRSLTKCFAIPGFRLGFGIANKENAAIFNNLRLTWNLDNISTEVGAYYMDNAGSYMEVSRAYIKRERDWLMSKIGAMKGIKPLQASANYFLIDVSGTGLSSEAFTARMLGEKIVVRDCSSFSMLGDSFIRLAVRTREENEKLVKALENVAGVGR